MITSKLTAKGRTAIPKPILEALDLQPGDEIVYEIHSGRVVFAKAGTPVALGDPFCTFDEWRSEADAKAYEDL